MEPRLTRITPFTVRGIRVRTINRDEGNSKTAKIPGLWGRFFAESIQEKVPRRSFESPIYGVYSSYESDGNGAYDLTLGLSVTEVPPSRGLDAVEIEAGDYLVFEAQGPMPRIVIDTWGAIWKFFASESQLKRKFTTDFEEYRGSDAVSIHIAVRR